MEKIQMTEEQARELFSDIGLVETIDMAIDESKKHGYIRKSAVEEAEEMYDNMIKNYSTTCGDFKIAVDYINILKSEIERLKK